MSRRLLAVVVMGLLASAAHAQDKTGPKKLYCWNEGGRKVCGDALPATAVDSARTEISEKTGRATASLDRALTTEERAAADAQAAEARAQAEANEAAHRRFMAMVTTFATEADLRRAFDTRLSLSHDSIKTATMGVDSLRQSLVHLLKRAGDAELSGRPVPKKIATDIQSQHAQLERQRQLLVSLNRDAAKIRGQLDEALTRYREIKAQPNAARPAG